MPTRWDDELIVCRLCKRPVLRASIITHMLIMDQRYKESMDLRRLLASVWAWRSQRAGRDRRTPGVPQIGTQPSQKSPESGGSLNGF